jgi:protoporphyrinogen IX oxidase
MFLTVKALHIIFIVTWFAGLFYIVRLFIYDVEAEGKLLSEKKVIQEQLRLMQTRLWYGITWPSMVLTLILGAWLSYLYPGPLDRWFVIKLSLVFFLVLYHLQCERIYRKLKRGNNRWGSQQLRIWNELATLLLFSIVFVVVLKNQLGLLWGLGGFLSLAALLLVFIRLYKRTRKKNSE